MATNEQLEKVINDSYIEGQKETLESVMRQELNIEFEIRTLEQKIQEEEQKIKEENKKSNRWSGEIKNFFMIRDYLNVINNCAITPTYKLKIVALAYRKTKQHFEIKIYTADKWQQYFIAGISNILAEHWIQEVGEEVFVDYNQSEIIKDKIYISTFLIPPEHLEDGELQFFYNI